jgi:hypothetical protein
MRTTLLDATAPIDGFHPSPRLNTAPSNSATPPTEVNQLQR